MLLRSPLVERHVKLQAVQKMKRVSNFCVACSGGRGGGEGGSSYIWAIRVSAAVKGIVFKPFSLV